MDHVYLQQIFANLQSANCACYRGGYNVNDWNSAFNEIKILVFGLIEKQDLKKRK